MGHKRPNGRANLTWVAALIQAARLVFDITQHWRL